MEDSKVAWIMKEVEKKEGWFGLSVSKEWQRQQALTDVGMLMNKPSLI